MEQVKTDTTTITVELPETNAWQLAQFIKRVSFDTFYDATEGHLPVEERKRRAYQMIHSLELIRSELAKVGIAPR